MWMVAELVLLSWLTASTWWLWRLGPVCSVHAVVGVLMAYVLAALGAMVVDQLVGWLQGNLWLRVVIACVIGTIIFTTVLWYWKRDAERRRARWEPRLNRWRLQGPLRIGLIALWQLGHIAVVVIVVNLLLVAWPQLTHGARHSSGVMRFLLGTPSPTSMAHATQAQLHGLMGFHHQVTRGVDGLLQATGARRTMETMEALSWIVALPTTELERLVSAEPTLQRLVDDPDLRAVIDDPQLMELVQQAAEGSFLAVYALGDESGIQRLMASPGMRAALAAIDPVALRRRHEPIVALSSIMWSITAMPSSLALDARLADLNAWTMITDTDVLEWPGNDRYGVARATVTVSEGARLQIETLAAISCWVDNELVSLDHQHQARVAQLATGPRVIVVVFDFGGRGGARVATLRLSAGSATGY